MAKNRLSLLAGSVQATETPLQAAFARSGY
jgi:hypothetical protein